MKLNIYDIQIKQTYKIVNGKYIQSNRKSVADVDVKFGKKMDNRLMCINDLLVTNLLAHFKNYHEDETFFLRARFII